MNSKILNTIANVIDNKEEAKKRLENGRTVVQELSTCVQNCQHRFGGKSELATEDDVRIINLCENWERALSHGIRTNLTNSAIQSLVSAGLKTFSFVNIGNSLWSYTCLHLTKHEKERFKILSNINTPIGYFRAFLRATLNERSLERYLQSWLGHGLLMEYYDEGALVRDAESSNTLIRLAADLSSILFALSIDRAQLNESSQNNTDQPVELVIPLTAPINPTSKSKKPLRQVISFDKTDENPHRDKRITVEPDHKYDSHWSSAPTTCVNSPDPVAPQMATSSEPTSSDYKTSIRQFFPEGVKSIDSPSQILTKLSECAKEIFSSTNSIENNTIAKDDVSERSLSNLKIYESDESEDVAVSIDGSTSCLELCFTEDESVPEDSRNVLYLENKDKECMNWKIKYSQLELASKEKNRKLEKVIMDISKENDTLKDQLRHYMSAVEMGKAFKTGNCGAEEETQYEKKLVQVAEMHAELMEFNQHLQRRLQELESKGPGEDSELPDSNVKVHIPSAFLVGKSTHSYHVYQIFLKIGLEEWNVYHRYAKFHELHMQLRKCHPDIASYKFPPKKTLRKRNAAVVEQRRVALQAYLRHVVAALPELRRCTSRQHLVTLLPFFGISSTTSKENGFNQILRQQPSAESLFTYDAM